MDLFILLDFISGLDEEQKSKALEEEYHRQRVIFDSLCECERRKGEKQNA